MNSTIRVGGVPEHFNLPWHLAIENEIFQKSGLTVEWVTFKGGTGAMTQALRNQEVDCCVLLTEGIVKDIINGSASKIISCYINTPLIWGIHTGSDNPLQFYGEIYDQQYAISRPGSGSHLMPMVDAFYKKRQIDSEQFTIINNLDNALLSLAAKETDVFYWEKFTTKPYVDDGRLRRVGEYITPWPCFLLAATNQILDANSHGIKTLLDNIHFVCSQFMRSLDNIDQVSERYHQNREDVEDWFYCTEWSTSAAISDKMLSNVMHTLLKVGITDREIPVEDLIYKI